MAFATAPGIDAEWTFVSWKEQSTVRGRARLSVPVGPSRRDWETPSPEVAVLASLYLFSDYEAVRAYLRQHGAIRALLFDAFPRIVHVFGESVQLLLEIQEDPDEDADDTLLITIQEASSDLALARLGELDASWWRDTAADYRLVIIDVE